MNNRIKCSNQGQMNEGIVDFEAAMNRFANSVEWGFLRASRETREALRLDSSNAIDYIVPLRKKSSR